MSVLEHLISEVAVCKMCHSGLTFSISKRVGLACTLNLECVHCDFKASKANSPSSEITIEDKQKVIFDINVRFVYALRSIGIGQEPGEVFAGVMNLHKPSKFAFYKKVLLDAAKKVCNESMKNAVEKAVFENEGSRDIAAAFDGSWQKRGFSSLNGVMTATSITTGEVLDVEIFSKFCLCKERLQGEHNSNCIANYSGTSGGMEVAGALNMFRRSQDNYGVRYEYYLGDGDCKGFETVSEAQPYGPDFKIKKLECVGHVQKRMGTRLRKYKQKNSKKKLGDGKTVGGRSRLTDVAINTVQLYYGLAIRRNCSKGVEAMKEAIWAEYFHMGSTDDFPKHGKCPADSDTWCKYQLARINNEVYRHEEHFHLPPAVMKEIRPIFTDLSNDFLLSKCVHGGTQNVSESLNSVIWNRIPKKVFVRIDTLKFGVYDAISCYNQGNVSKCLIFKLLDLEPGFNCVSAMKSIDDRRVTKAEKAISEIEKKCRQSNTLKRARQEEEFMEDEDPDHPSYATGHY